MRTKVPCEYYHGVLMASGASSASHGKSHVDNDSKEIGLDSKSTGTVLVSRLPSSDAKTVQLVLAQPSSQQLEGSAPGRAPVVIASVSASEQTKKSSLVAKLTQSSGEHLTGGQVAKLCASTPQMNTVTSTGSGKPKAFATLMGSGDGASATTTPKKQSSSKKGHTAKGGGSGRSHQQSKSKPSPSNSAGDGPTRTSQRSIKRPRTYDEDNEFESPPSASKSGSKKPKSHPKGSKSVGPKPVGSTVPKASAAAKDLGRWRPTDDLMLISAVQQTNDLSAVHLGVKFSCRFTLREVEERWYALLYDPQISKIAIKAMRSLHPGVVTMALNNALWSQEEEAVLAKIPSTDPGHLEKFQSVLRENPAVFHACRTATSLHHHWVLMGHYGLLNNQKVDLILPEESLTQSFEDAEDQLNDNELARSRDVREEALEQELMAADRQAKEEILKLEEELPSWRTLIDAGSSSEFGADEYALLQGRVVEFRMTDRMVTLGRSTPSCPVTFDLSLEGPAYKISRRQASIELTDEGEFVIHNEGRRPLYLSGKALLSGNSAKLSHNQTLEIASMSFLILLNSKLASSLNSTVS